MASSIRLSCAPSTAAARIAFGAGIGAPLTCLVTLAGKLGSIAASAGVDGVPPGILKPLRSHGWVASGFSAIQALAASTSWSAGTTSSMRPISLAASALNCLPVVRTLVRAVARPSRRVTRVTPPPPGSSPRVTSGRPTFRPLASEAMRWWVARATSRPPPRAAPLIAATTGTPRVSRARKLAFIPSHMSRVASASAGPAVIMDLISPPAKKVFFAEVMTTPVISLASTAACSLATVSARESRKASFMTLTGADGSSMVRVTTPLASASQPMMFSLIVAPC